MVSIVNEVRKRKRFPHLVEETCGVDGGPVIGSPVCSEVEERHVCSEL